MCLPTSGICPYCDTFFEDFKHHLIFKTNDSVKNSHCDECEFVHPNSLCVSNHSHKVHVETKPENVLKCDIEIEEGGLTCEIEFNSLENLNFHRYLCHNYSMPVVEKIQEARARCQVEFALDSIEPFLDISFQHQNELNINNNLTTSKDKNKSDDLVYLTECSLDDDLDYNKSKFFERPGKYLANTYYIFLTYTKKHTSHFFVKKNVQCCIHFRPLQQRP